MAKLMPQAVTDAMRESASDLAVLCVSVKEAVYEG